MTQDVFDFSQIFNFLTEKFIGRKWIFEEIEDWLCNKDEQLFILTGEPGAGKSAIAAQLTQIRKDIIAYHFCSVAKGSTTIPGNIVSSLAAQIGNSLETKEYYQSLAENPRIQINVKQLINTSQNSNIIGVLIEEINMPSESLQDLQRLWDDVVRKPLSSLTNPPEQLKLIVIDALDEACTYNENLVKLLGKTKDLPSWIRLLLTTRPENRVLKELEPLKPYQCLIEKRSTQNMADIKEYIQERTEEPAIQEQIRKVALNPQTLVNEITKLADGNFLFAKLLLDDIGTGEQPLDDLSALPKDIYDLYLGFLNRLESWENSYQPIMGTLTVTQEPVTENQLSHFTKIPRRELRKSLGTIRQFLSEVKNDSGKVAYVLFHQSMRDYLLNEERNQNYWCDFKEEHEKITSYYLSKHPHKWDQETRLYGLKHIFTHLKFAEQVDEAVDLLSNLNFISGKIDYLGGEDLLEDFYSCYRLLISEGEDSMESQIDQLLTSLFKYLLEITPAEDGKFDLDYVHSNLVHRTDTRFYERFLQLGVDRESISACTSQPERLSSKISNLVILCQKYLANLKRRKGELQEAELLLEKVLESVENSSDQNSTTFKERARLEYDIGYIQWLRGRINDAVENLHQSSVYAAQAEDEVGKWISLCVEYRLRFYGGLCSTTEFESILKEGLSHFQKADKAKSHPAAARWVTTVYSHLFEISYATSDVSKAEEYWAILQEDSWISKHKHDHPLLKSYQARLAILKKDWDEAIAHFREYFGKIDDIEKSKKESISRDYYDYGLALKESGNYSAAQQLWEEALQIPDEPGNHIWKQKIREALQNL